MTFPCCKPWESVISSPKDPVNSWNTSYLKYECQEHGTYIEQIGNTWQHFWQLQHSGAHTDTWGKRGPWRRVSLIQWSVVPQGNRCYAHFLVGKVHTARVKFKSRIRYGKLTSAKEASLDTENKLYWNKVHLFEGPISATGPQVKCKANLQRTTLPFV